jgi:hypothetical protein
MEDLFSPCTRLLALLGIPFDFLDFEDIRDDFQHVRELNLDVSTQYFSSPERGFTYADLHTILEDGNTMIWFTSSAAVFRENGRAHVVGSHTEFGNSFRFNADGKAMIVMTRSREALSEFCDAILRLLAVSAVHQVDLQGIECENSPFAAPSLAYLMEQCQRMKTLTLENIALNEDHIRVLGDFSKPDLEIVLKDCRITGAASTVLAQVLGTNKGPTGIVHGDVDNFLLADGLRGNSRLKDLIPLISSNVEVGSREVLAYTRALPENLGLVVLKLDCFLSDETWDAVCDSLKAHPTLEILDLRATIINENAEHPVPPAVIKSRIQALLGMLKVNTSIRYVCLDQCLFSTNFYHESIIPHLETNRFRPDLLAIQKTRPHVYRAKVLGRSLLAVRTDPNQFWMLLSGNAEVAFPPRTANITATASLPAPATDAATVHVAPAAATHVATEPSTDNSDTPTVGQKRRRDLN